MIMKIAWIGTGVMGSAMLLHLKQAGHEVCAYNRTKEKADRLCEYGVTVTATIAECVKGADVVMTMVGYPKDVSEVYQEIFSHATTGCICIDFTTSSPSLASELYEKGKALGIEVLDAPVSGGDSGAKTGTLSIMVGGDYDIYEKVTPLFQTMGTPRYMGKTGSGQHTKACNQICVAGAVSALCEAIHYARVNGLDEANMLDAIAKGAAGSWQINNTGPRILKEDYEPGFYVKHFIKDMHIVQEVMKENGEVLPMLDTVCATYEGLAQKGFDDKGTQCLIKYYED